MLCPQNSQNPAKKMRNITAVFNLSESCDLAAGSDITCATRVDSVIYQIPSKKWRWKFSCRHKQSVSDWQGCRLISGPGGGEKGDGQGRRTELEKAGWVGKKEKRKERARRGLETL